MVPLAGSWAAFGSGGRAVHAPSGQARPQFAWASHTDRDEAARLAGIGSAETGEMHMLAQHTGSRGQTARHAGVLTAPLPYHESDHVLGISYNVLCGGPCLQDIEQRR